MVTWLALVPAAAGAAERIVMLGDSITAGYGLPPQDALPHRLEAELKKAGLEATVENAGVSGDTTASGLSRVDWAVQGKPDLVIIALGANDGLRGIDPAETRRNLEAIVRKLRERQIPVLVAGMMAPPNLGHDYAAKFNPLFAEVAKAEDARLYPFLLEGVAARPSLNQDDGIHPNAAGAEAIARRMAPKVIEILDG